MPSARSSEHRPGCSHLRVPPSYIQRAVRLGEHVGGRGLAAPKVGEVGKHDPSCPGMDLAIDCRDPGLNIPNLSPSFHGRHVNWTRACSPGRRDGGIRVPGCRHRLCPGEATLAEMRDSWNLSPQGPLLVGNDSVAVGDRGSILVALRASPDSCPGRCWTFHRNEHDCSRRRLVRTESRVSFLVWPHTNPTETGVDRGASCETGECRRKITGPNQPRTFSGTSLSG